MISFFSYGVRWVSAPHYTLITPINVKLSHRESEEHDGCLVHRAFCSLGAANDGDPPLSNIPGHPGARRCNASDHYLMGERDPGSANFYKLSKCTEGQIRYVLS